MTLEFDNPYQRSFSNYQRYKTSIFEDTYWLEDPVYGFLIFWKSAATVRGGNLSFLHATKYIVLLY